MLVELCNEEFAVPAKVSMDGLLADRVLREAAAEHSPAMESKYEERIAALRSQPESLWMEGLSPEEPEPLRKMYARCYNK